MDATLLRLILLALGILLVVGIYLFDRRRRAPASFHKAAHRHQPVFIDETTGEDRIDLVSYNDDEEDLESSIDSISMTAESEPEAIDDSFSAHGETDYLHLDPALRDDLPQMVVQINLRSKNEKMNGEQIAEAMLEMDMHFGAMNLYHRFDNQDDRVMFSLVSMVEPGNFPADDMVAFETPGIALFTQLPGIKDGLVIYADMLFTAERLSAILDAELLDEEQNILTKQSIAHTRDLILEHRQQVRLAQRRA